MKIYQFRIITLVMTMIFTLSGTGLVVAQLNSTQPSVAVAEETTTTTDIESTDGLSQRIKTKFDKARAERIKRACSTATTRLQAVAGRIDEAKDKRVNLYRNLVRVLNQFVERLEANDYDASQLSSDIGTLQSLGDEVGVAWGEYKVAVMDVASSDCKNNPQTFHDNLELARDKFAIVREKVKNAKDFIHDTIKADLKQIRDEVVAKKQSQNGTDSTVPTSSTDNQ